MTTDTTMPPPPQRAGLPRRLAGMFYDTLLLVALLLVTSALFLLLTRGEAIDPRTHPALELIYRLVLAVLIVGYFGVSWTRSGQTLGMATWRLRVEREDGRSLTWDDTLRRLGWALVSLLPAGLGFAWVLVDPERRAWHDRLSRTRVVVVPKR